VLHAWRQAAAGSGSRWSVEACSGQRHVCTLYNTAQPKPDPLKKIRKGK